MTLGVDPAAVTFDTTPKKLLDSTSWKLVAGRTTIADAWKLAQQADIGGVLLRHRYPREGAAPSPEITEVSTRCAHRQARAFLTPGGFAKADRSPRSISSACTRLVTGPAGADRWRHAHRVVTGKDDGVDWRALTDLPDDGAVLVRPDGFVASRSDETLTPQAA